MMKILIGIEIDGYLGGDVKADIVPGKSIRIYGTHRGVYFDKTFEIGDEAEYGSYNLIYTGKIVKIGPKTVTIQAYGRENHRLNLNKFSWRNWDFDAEAIAAQNAETSMYI